MRRLQQSAATSATLLNLFLWDTDNCKEKIEEYHSKSYGTFTTLCLTRLQLILFFRTENEEF